MEEITNFVSENAEENVAVTFRPVRITSDYLSDRLIDGLVKRVTSVKTTSLLLGPLRTHRNKILDRRARYPEIACSRLKTDFNRMWACSALIRSSAPPRKPLPLPFSACFSRVCGLSMSSAMASKISRRWSSQRRNAKIWSKGMILLSRMPPTPIRSRRDAFE